MPDLVILIPYLALLLISIMVHEVAHGFVAERLGDPTARLAGRLTLNPLAHIDPIGTVLLPLVLVLSGSGFLFGWAKPVPIQPRNFADPRFDEAKVALAGPASNLGVALLAALLIRLAPAGGLIGTVLVATVHLNLVLMLFNLIPIPPLDGSKLLALFLPDTVAEALERVNPLVVLFVLLVVLQSAGVSGWLGSTVEALARLLIGN